MAATIVLSEYSTLVDESVFIRLAGFVPNSHVTVRAVTNNVLGLPCVAESLAVFLTDEQGTVELDLQAPVSGTYHGVDLVQLTGVLVQDGQV